MEISALYEIFLRHPEISTDTRRIQPGCIFFALQGEHFDGNAFASLALDQGAAYAVISDPSQAGERKIFVPDTLATLQALALHHRRQFRIPVIGITGSNGKTTTKELMAAALSARYNVYATAGNLNNHIGVPLTLLRTPAETQILVCEMGANHAGEIAFLCSLAEPTHGIITNIGKAHLEGFGSLEGVKHAKGELFAFVSRHQGICFVNADDHRLRDLGEHISKKITYGLDPEFHPDILFSYQPQPDQSGFILRRDSPEDVTITSGMFGHYNAINMVAAYTVARHFEVPDHLIAAALSSYTPVANRSEVIRHQGATIIKDAYNANPSSMELAIRAFIERYPKGWLVLGDMKEVGEYSKEAHAQMIALARSFDVERIYLTGPEFELALSPSDRMDPRLRHGGRIEEIREHWNWADCQGKAILLKGSRSMRLEQLLEG